ncbi:hypothetical protein GGX14DRAFT_653889 [Mycena pura]|uniref:MYND-type domain-containing protein n=1 Tax=Mycena pura TaxID=153505 RepID=A0AAD6V4M7_9AGAR|nr:hypothetical protein GGX14DRAFT_653889 [Mycena pura]
MLKGWNGVGLERKSIAFNLYPHRRPVNDVEWCGRYKSRGKLAVNRRHNICYYLTLFSEAPFLPSKKSRSVSTFTASTSYNMGFGNSPKSPSFEKDRRGWNAAWERDLATIYGSAVEISFPGRQEPPSIIGDLATEYYEMMNTDAHVLSLTTMTTQICVLQRDLTRKSSQRFAVDDFETHWTTRCSAKEREDFILEGLVRACPELTLQRLNQHSGKGYIELLRKLTLQDVDKVPDDFNTVPNTVYDKINAVGQNPHPGLAIAKKSCDCGRVYLLTMVVWNILLAFYGESEEYGLIKGQRDDPAKLKRIKQLASDMGVKRLASETAANRQRAERHCTSCGLPASKAGVETLLACQRCKSIDRMIFYCSKKCQTADWKTGRPPHKSICGKPGAVAEAFFAPKVPEPDDDDADDDDDDDDDDFWGEPNPGYTRSPALLHQLKLLKENPQLDYVLVRPNPHPDHGIVMQDALGGMFFKICMKRAVNGQSPREVYKMFQQLEPSARGAPGFGVEKLKQQFFKEYGYNVDTIKAQFYS